MNPLLTILAGTCLLLTLSQQLIGAGAQEEVTSAASTVTGESTTSKDAGDPSKEDKPTGGKGHDSLVGIMREKCPGGMKGDQKKPMGDFHKFGDKLGPGMQRPAFQMTMGGFGDKKPGQGGMPTGGFKGPMGGFGVNRRQVAAIAFETSIVSCLGMQKN
ncbi:hypothetical protein pipiens_009796 [Culex pipiens pipiens]|uniref:Uncharacterized protein n=1 Tax=Culex pipiens pipiens TaxID=38569 RepID=A0ABD1DCI7_CULPP